jgi:hypothetical protein
MNFELLPILTDYANYKKGGCPLKKFLFSVMVAILDTGQR